MSHQYGTWQGGDWCVDDYGIKLLLDAIMLCYRNNMLQIGTCTFPLQNHRKLGS